MQHAPPERIQSASQVVNNYMGTNIFASGHASVQFNQVNAANWDDLKKYLKQSSALSDEDVKELEDADKQDGGKLGSGVSEWIKKMAPKALVGGLKLGTEVAQKVLTEALLQHYNLKS